MKLRLEGVSRIYKMDFGEIRALDGTDFKLEPNEFVAIMGPSGSGKSTLMNIIGCLDRPTSGRYFMDNVNVGNLKDNSLAEIRNRKIGFIFQTFNLLPKMTVLKNVELPLIYAGYKRGKKRLERARTVLKSVGLADRAFHKPNELSGGQKQRVAIARALVTGPTLFLADEPTGNLDSSTGREIMNIFCRLNDEGKSIVMVTHEQSMAQYAHRIIRLKDGKILANS